MRVKQEASGRRSLQVEVEVPGTPEEVWQAIATGPGVSSWFMPTEFEERDGKPVSLKVSFGPCMEAKSVITVWDAPRRFVNESESWVPDSPPIATEWNVEARAGGTCIVRIVQSLFASTDQWDDQLEGGAAAWPAFLRSLRIYLTHFRGQHGSLIQLSTPVACSEAEAWETLTCALGVNGLKVGQRWTSHTDVSDLGGVLEYATENPYDVLLRLDTPCPGIAAVGAMTYPGGQTMVAVNFYLYGEQAAGIAARDTAAWEAWLQNRFPMPAEA
jgi:uncharacterized protein YndB with AHSA1/START domain